MLDRNMAAASEGSPHAQALSLCGVCPCARPSDGAKCTYGPKCALASANASLRARYCVWYVTAPAHASASAKRRLRERGEVGECTPHSPMALCRWRPRALCQLNEFGLYTKFTKSVQSLYEHIHSWMGRVNAATLQRQRVCNGTDGWWAAKTNEKRLM
jgi:hypothetical protein